MNLKEVIKAEKTNVEAGQWHAGHIPRAAFPLSKVKERNYKIGASYSWRLVKFQCLGKKCRVLIYLNEDKEVFRARLGVEDGSDMVVLCDYEFHSSEPGWHCHFTIKPISSIEPGAVRGGKRRRPILSDPNAKFAATKASALSIAAKRFGFEMLGDRLI